MRHILQTFGCLLLLFYAQSGWSACQTIDADNEDLGTFPSITFSENGVSSSEARSGFTCTSLSLAIVATSYIKYVVTSLDNRLINSENGDIIYFNLRDHQNKPVSQGTQNTDISTKVLLLFNSVTGDLPFYVTIPAGQLISPGSYQSISPIAIRWHFAIPSIAASCLLGYYHKSPGLTMNMFSCGVSNWGTGIESHISYKITILPDCRIIANDINFGSAPFSTSFEPVQTTLGVRCSAKTPYSVGLDGGQYFDGSLRHMQSQSGDELAYEIYKMSDQQRWGIINTERWSSDQASVNAGIYDGKTQQSYIMRAEVLPSNSNDLPAGEYSDKITVDISF